MKKYLEDKEACKANSKIKQVKNRIGAPDDQKRTLDELGRRKLNRVIENENTTSIQGMITKVKHLVKVVE